MLFNSIEFLIFLPIVFILYWSISKKIYLQNVLLLTVSYFFYGLWDWRFLSLIIISSLVDYIIGIQLKKQTSINVRKFLLGISAFVNLGFLLFFKYCNFFVDSFYDFCTLFNYQPSITTLKIVLPVGISFYTFQTLSYSIDVYRNKLVPTRNVLNFFTYVAFFPQLVAGPIERAINLLPQIEQIRKFNYEDGRLGLRQILWGFFKKVAIADNCALIVDPIFENSEAFGSIGLIIGAFFFAIQIYCDFSGYSDIAIGTAKLLGIKLMQNFNFPYFARDVSEFWRKWHISLSTWFRDYIYIPLGGSRVSTGKQVRNIFTIFLVSGFWHGANWTFIFWGLIHALFFLPLLLMKKNRKYTDSISKNTLLPTIIEIFKILKTFIIVTIAWIFFRVDTITEGFLYLKGIFTQNFIDPVLLEKLKIEKLDFNITCILILVMFIIEWFNREQTFGLEKVSKYRFIRLPIYLLICICVIQFFFSRNEFIYFQF